MDWIRDVTAVFLLLLPVLYLLYKYWKGDLDKPIEPKREIPEAPAPCPVCSGKLWLEVGVKRVIPARGIRSFQFPESGVAKIQHFKCIKCGYMGRYGMAMDRQKNGWILLDRWMGGW